MKDQLKKAIALSKKTGDRLMVYDISESHDPYIVMAIDDYEKIVLGNKQDESEDLTDTQLTDKINRDIAVWKDDQTMEQSENIKDESDNDNEPVYEQFREKEGVAEIEIETDDESQDDKPQRGWNIPKSRRENTNI